MMTGRPGIFAGGDMVPAERSVTIATGHGEKAARNIDAWLRGTAYAPAPKHPAVDFAGLNLPIYADAAPLDGTLSCRSPRAARPLTR